MTKDASSRGSRNPSPKPGLSSQAIEDSPAEPGLSTRAIEDLPASITFAQFPRGELDEAYFKLVAPLFADGIKDDMDANLIDLNNVAHFLGYKHKVQAIELLSKNYLNTRLMTANMGDVDEVLNGDEQIRLNGNLIQYMTSFD